jgi:hypothetical protein
LYAATTLPLRAVSFGADLAAHVLAGSEKDTVEPHRVPGEGDAGVLQTALEPAAECAGKSSGRAYGAVGEEEGGVETDEGMFFSRNWGIWER